ncbi:hypothetical protein C8R48DRAFT_750601 [Suillus tomentosus]|nr:hypothetical protein C8R48DRAFT_750601 [Suillus tomentosus]
MCDLQVVQFYLYLSQQFSIVLDVYLQILTNVNTLLHEAIGQQDPNWHLKHCCPANDSLKRVLKRLAKYPLAIVSKLLDVFGKDLGGGQHARKLNYMSCVGAFHGHAHQQLCQLDNLATYVKGLGLKDLKGCEQTFSK